MSKPSINDIIKAAGSAIDLINAGEDALGELRTVADLLHAYKVQGRKLKNAKPAMQPWHRWRRNRLAEKLRERLGLGPLDPIPDGE